LPVGVSSNPDFSASVSEKKKEEGGKGGKIGNYPSMTLAEIVKEGVRARPPPQNSAVQQKGVKKGEGEKKKGKKKRKGAFRAIDSSRPLSPEAGKNFWGGRSIESIK